MVATRADHLTDAERTVVAKCALCGEGARGRRNEHLLFECTAPSVVKLRKEVEAAVEKKMSRLVKPGPVRDAIMVPWRLDKAGIPPNVGVHRKHCHCFFHEIFQVQIIVKYFMKFITQKIP